MNDTAALSPLERIPPHRIEPGLLPRSEQQALRRWVLDRAAMLAPSQIGSKANPATRPNFRNSLTLPLDELGRWLPMLREQIGARLPAICAAFGVALQEAGKMEFEAVVYRDGAFYRRHVDTWIHADLARQSSSRILSAVYYFHDEPRGFEGGALRLYPAVSTERHLDIDPQANALLVFPSWAPHEVMPVRCPSGAWEDSRLAINCWIHRAAPSKPEGQ